MPAWASTPLAAPGPRATSGPVGRLRSAAAACETVADPDVIELLWYQSSNRRVPYLRPPDTLRLERGERRRITPEVMHDRLDASRPDRRRRSGIRKPPWYTPYLKVRNHSWHPPPSPA